MLYDEIFIHEQTPFSKKNERKSNLPLQTTTNIKGRYQTTNKEGKDAAKPNPPNQRFTTKNPRLQHLGEVRIISRIYILKNWRNYNNANLKLN